MAHGVGNLLLDTVTHIVYMPDNVCLNQLSFAQRSLVLTQYNAPGTREEQEMLL